MIKFFLKTKSIVSILLVSTIALSGCSETTNSARPAGGNNAAPSKAIPVELTSAEIGTAASYYITTATLEPNSDAQINARTAGVVRKILREEGDDVVAGELLLLLEDDDQKLRLKQAQQNLASAEREYNRLNRMKKAGAVAANEWEAANNALLSATTDVELAELGLSYTRITAPFDGRVVWREVDRGQGVSVGNLLFRIMSIKPLLLRVHVPANRIGNIAKGQTVALNIDSAKLPLSGIIDLVSPIVDPATGTIKVTVVLQQYPQSVRPGDFTEVRIITDQREDAMLLPNTAIIEERGQHYLFVAEQNKAVRKEVEIGYVVGEKTEILSGIAKTDLVVSKGQRNLNDGNDLLVIEADTSMGVVKQTQSDSQKKQRQES